MIHPTYLGGVPSLDDVRDAFKNHLENYSTSRGEQAQVLRNSEASVKLQYEGGSHSNCWQNALDRAEKDVWIALLDNDEGSTLVVANDGAPVTLDPAFNYDRPTLETGVLISMVSGPVTSIYKLLKPRKQGLGLLFTSSSARPGSSESSPL